jgi:hypothetical protein
MRAPLLLPLLSLGCPSPEPENPDDTTWITGSTRCALPEGATVPVLPPVGTAAAEADAFFADEALPLFELRISSEAWAQVCENASNYAHYLWELDQGLDPALVEHAYAPATLIFQGTTYDPVGVRFRGRTTVYALFWDGDAQRPDAMERCLAHTLGEKASLKISLDEYGLSDEIAGQQTFNLVSSEGSDSAYLREVLALRLAAAAGLAAPRAGHARLCLNGAYEGLFSLVEEADTQRFLAQHFPGADDGGYWKVETDGDQTWSSSWDDGGWERVYIPKGGTAEGDPGALRDLLEAGSLVADGAQDDAIAAALDGLLDVDAWRRQIALDLAMPDYDGMFGNQKNYLLYDHPARGFMVVPYDKDLAFVDLDEYSGGTCPGDVMGAHPCWSAVREGPAVARWLLETDPEAYLDEVGALLDELYLPDDLTAWLVAQYEILLPWIEADRYYREGSPACLDDPENCGYLTVGAWEWSVLTWMPEQITARAEELRRQLAGGAPCEDPCGG